MPRNGSGTYSLPQGSFVPLTVISSASVNSDLSDIASALTTSVSSDGQTPMTGAIRQVNGTQANPAVVAATDLTTGFYFPTVGQVGWAWSGNAGAIFNNDAAGGVLFSNAVTVSGNLTVSGNTVFSGTASFSGTAGIQIPSGTTGQRPGVPVTGQIRYNSTNGNFEGFDGTEWNVLSSITERYSISASASANLLTVSILNAITGAAPTAADPILMRFRNVSDTAGSQTAVVVSSTLTINTNATGASLGVVNGSEVQSNIPFRYWIVAFNNAGTVVLGLINCSIAGQVFPLDESTDQSSTGISAAATSAGVYYTPNGVTVSSKAIKILGYLEYSAGLATPGTYGTQPTRAIIFGPGVKKPGDVVQSNSLIVSNNVNITPTSIINQVKITASGQYNSSGPTVSMAIRRGSVNISGTVTGQLVGNVSGGGLAVTTFNLPFCQVVLDAPNTTSSTGYNTNPNPGAGTQNILVEEIMS